MRIICPACGLSSLVLAEQGQGVIKCAGCGKRIHWGIESADAPPLLSVEDDVGFVAPPMEPVSRVSKRPSGGPNPRFMIVAIAVGMVTAALLLVLAVVVQKAMTPAKVATVPITPPPTTAPIAWDRAHRGQLQEMKDRAESLALAHQWQESYDAYRQIIATVADHDLTDPVVVQVIAGARVGEDRVLAMLMTPATVEKTAAAVTQPTTAIAASATTQATSMPVAAVNTTPTTAVSPAAPVAQLDPAEIAADGAPAMPGQPPPPPDLHAYTLPDVVTDAEIGEAITKGVNFLKGQFRNGEITTLSPVKPANKQPPAKAPPPPDKPHSNLDHASDLGDLPPPPQPITPGPAFTAPWDSAFSVPGIDALCVYALLHSGQAMDQKILGEQDPFTDRILTVLKQYNLIFTYHRSLRAAALSVYDRMQDTAALEEDVRWLLVAGQNGAYTYTIPTTATSGQWDNSNSQYGLLGVWSGAMAGKAVPQDYWRNVERHWNASANTDGTFGYSPGTSSTTMTCAGVASLLVARDYLESTDMVGKAASKTSPNPAIENGLNWLDAGDNCMSAWENIGGTGYALYGLERVGLASGFKYFGRHDWYSELAKRLVAEQHFDGSWGANPPANGNIAPQTLVDTAYALLFLARGRHPILYNKLRYEGDWNDRPHEISHLARFASHELERPLNWQVVNLRRNWFDWMDSPVLYIAGDKKPNFTDKDFTAIRAFADGGGLIFTHADAGSPEFTRWVIDMTRKIFPKYELMQVPRDSAVYSTVYRLKDPPPLLSISNGSRLLLIHSPTDISVGWQLDWPEEKKAAFQLGVNIFVYAAGKGSLKNRLASSYIPENPDRPDGTRQIARLQYAAEWDPEPYAWARFRRYFQWETHQAVEPVTVPLKELQPGSFPLAVLTGTVRHDFTEAEQLAARAYVQSGGILMIDACGGQDAFVKSTQNTLLPQAFEGVSPLPIGANHPLLVASRPHADDLSHPMLRGFANENGGKEFPILAIAYGKGWVIFSRLDLTTGLLGTQSWGIMGFDPAYSQALMKNAVLWAEARSPVVAVPATKP